jgi:hypothetical protein
MTGVERAIDGGLRVARRREDDLVRAGEVDGAAGKRAGFQRIQRDADLIGRRNGIRTTVPMPT